MSDHSGHAHSEGLNRYCDEKWRRDPDYVPVPIAPDPARDARVAARRAADARKAGIALDHLLGCEGSTGPGGMREQHAAAFVELLADAIASRLQHNRHYGVPDEVAAHVPHLHEYDASPCSSVECHELNGDYCTWCGGQPCRVRITS
jgi:hypothetical protein